MSKANFNSLFSVYQKCDIVEASIFLSSLHKYRHLIISRRLYKIYKFEEGNISYHTNPYLKEEIFFLISKIAVTH
jgi:hypothetical protein